MLLHLLYSHWVFRLLLISLGLAIAIVAFYLFMNWRQGKPPKFISKPPHRLQSAKWGSKKCHTEKET
jgi:hypothetical protein